MMFLIAVYIPKFTESNLGYTLLLLVIAISAMILFAKQRWGFKLSACFILGASLCAMLYQLLPILGDGLGSYGDVCRRVNNSTLPDWCFIVFSYFDFGGDGIITAAVAACTGWLLLEIIGWLWLVSKRRGTEEVKSSC